MPSPTNVTASLPERLADAEAAPVGVPMLVKSASGWHVLGEDGQRFDLVPHAQVEAEKGLPEEIVKATENAIGRACEVVQEAHEGTPESTMRAAGLSIEAQAALTATILARLTAAESAREALKDEIRDQAMKQLVSDAGWELDWDKVRAERDAALARAERAEKALQPFARYAEVYDCYGDDHTPEAMLLLIENTIEPDPYNFTVADLRAARAALAQNTGAEDK